MLGFTKKFMVEIFGSDEASGGRSAFGIILHFLKWGSVASTFLFVMGFMIYEFGVTVGVVEYRRASAQQEALADLVNVDDVMAEYGDQIETALRDGTIDAVLGHRRVPDDMKRRIKEEMRQRLQREQSSADR
jgi:hypothetical protein